MENNVQKSFEPLLTPEQMGTRARMFSRIRMPAGGEVAYHDHHGEVEVYYILSGHGIYNDNGKTYPVTAGDTTFCGDGSSHGMVNDSDGDLVFLAIILT